MLAVGDADKLQELALWGGIGLAGLVLFAIAAFLVRRKYHPLRSESASDDLLDLANLQRMRDREEITEAEYRRLKSRAIDALRTDGIGGNSGESGI